jgi:broad specificity phosphatase PhoE
MQLLTTLLLIRHGHTRGNASGPHVQMSGWTDLPLSARGEREAQAIAAYLARIVRPCVVYTSPLERALRTAAAIAEPCDAPIARIAGLREINCGQADGLTLAEVEERYPREWAKNLAQTDPDFRWPGGESYRELRVRAWTALAAIAALHPGECVVAVTHAGVISQVLGRMHGESAACWAAMRPRNASLTELVWSGDTARIARFDVVPSAHAA